MSQEENTNQEEQKTKSEKFKYTICYIPLVAIILFFIEDDKNPEFRKHIKYGSFLFIAYILLVFLFNLVLPFLNLGWILFLIYIIICIYLGYKAYSGEKVELEYFDKIEEKIKDKL